MTVHERPFGRYFEDFEPGDVYKHWPGKTITEYDDHLFCMITMNHHPLHTDAWYAETQTQFGKNVVVGNLVYSLVLGMSVARRERCGDRQPRGRDAPAQEADVPRRHHLRRDEGAREEGVVEQARPWDRHRRDAGFNQRGEEVCYFRRKVMVPEARAAPAAASGRTRAPSSPDDVARLPVLRIVAATCRRRSSRRRTDPARSWITGRCSPATRSSSRRRTSSTLQPRTRDVAGSAVVRRARRRGHGRRARRRGELHRENTWSARACPICTSTSCPAAARTGSAASSGPGPGTADEAEADAVAGQIRKALPSA